MTEIETIGHTLKIARVTANIPQRTMAKALGVTANWISLVEKGRREPSLKFLRACAAYLHVPLHEYLWLALGGTTEDMPSRRRSAA